MLKTTPEERELRDELIKKYLEANVNLSDGDIASLILKENKNVKGAFKTIRKHVNLKRTELGLTRDLSVKVDLENDTKWRVLHNAEGSSSYYWKGARGEVNLSIEFVDNLFYEYSEHGLNLSATEIINKYDLQVWQWHSIKNTLQLYKKSHIFSPYTVQVTPPELLDEMVAQKVSKVFQSVGYQVEQQYNKQLRREYKKVIQKQTEADLIKQSVLIELQDIIPQAIAEFKEVTVNKAIKAIDRPLCGFIFDVHYGAENRTKDTPDYSPEETERRFTEIAREINSKQSKEVHLFFGGDNIESLTGMNHPDSWRGIAKGYIGAELIKRAYKAMVKFISQVNNVVSVNGVPGNHDRMTIKNTDGDNEGWVAEILFELIRLSFGNKIEINYEPKMLSKSIDGIVYLMSHGHFKLSDVNAADLVLEYGDPYLYNVLVSGHWHNRKIKADKSKFRQIVAPSVCATNDFALNNGMSSTPGFLMVYNNGKNKPTIIDHSL